MMLEAFRRNGGRAKIYRKHNYLIIRKAYIDGRDHLVLVMKRNFIMMLTMSLVGSKHSVSNGVVTRA